MRKLTAVTAGLVAYLTACSSPDFRVGATEFYLQVEGMDVWSDLPEAVHSMQQVTTMPTEAWSKTVLLLPAHEPTRLGPHTACFCDPDADLIQARTTDASQATMVGCLPHEFAHKWHVHIDPVSAQADPHGKDWADKFIILEEAASNTWLARRVQSTEP